MIKDVARQHQIRQHFNHVHVKRNGDLPPANRPASASPPASSQGRAAVRAATRADWCATDITQLSRRLHTTPHGLKGRAALSMTGWRGLQSSCACVLRRILVTGKVARLPFFSLSSTTSCARLENYETRWDSEPEKIIIPELRLLGCE